MNNINLILTFIINISIIIGFIYSLWFRIIFKIKAKAVRDFAKYADLNKPIIASYDKQLKLNALEKIITSGLTYEDKI